MSYPKSYRSSIRNQINISIRTDADFDAFCLDYFPQVHCRFSAGMDRTQKVNLLLEVVDHLDSITEKLNERYHSSTNTPASGYSTKRAIVPILLGVFSIVSFGFVVRGSDNLFTHRVDSQTLLAPVGKLDMAVPDISTTRLDIPFVGSLFDTETSKPFFEARVILVGTNCETKTRQSGYFSFTDCGQEQIKRIVSARINVLLPKMRTWCKDVPLLSPPLSAAIYINRKCKVSSMVAAAPSKSSEDNSSPPQKIVILGASPSQENAIRRCLKTLIERKEPRSRFRSIELVQVGSKFFLVHAPEEIIFHSDFRDCIEYLPRSPGGSGHVTIRIGIDR